MAQRAKNGDFIGPDAKTGNLRSLEISAKMDKETIESLRTMLLQYGVVADKSEEQPKADLATEVIRQQLTELCDLALQALRAEVVPPKVYVVIGGWDYEGNSEPTGVYSSREKAEAAKEHAQNPDNHSYDSLEIMEYDLDHGEREIELSSSMNHDEGTK